MRKNIKTTKRKMVIIAAMMSLMLAGTTACGKTEGDGEWGSNAPVSEATTEEQTTTEAKTEEGTTSEAATEATTEAATENASASDSSKGEAPSGDGLLSEEDIQKNYVWMDKIKGSLAFQLSYEDVVARFGVDGLFDKEEEVDGTSKRYYKWTSTEDDTHFIYINFAEKEEGKYTITSYNSSGFSSEEAADKYLSELESEAQEENKEAAANAETSSVTEDAYAFGDKDNAIKVTFDLPTGWSYKNNNGKIKIVENEDPEAFGAGFIQIEFKESAEKLDTYIDKFENLADTDSREINGITMTGRTYSYIGYDWTEYYAELPDGRAVSIGIVDSDIADGTMGDMVLKSLKW